MFGVDGSIINETVTENIVHFGPYMASIGQMSRTVHT